MRDAARTTGFGLENVIAVFLARRFGTPTPLSDVFDFGGQVPQWAKQAAQLVSLTTDTRRRVSGHPVDLDTNRATTVHLGSSASSWREDVAWFSSRNRTPFLFPSNFMGPDILFALQLESGSFLWVAVQSRYRSKPTLSKAQVEDAITTVTPSEFYVHAVSNCGESGDNL
jgi:hypothetical protein